MTPSSLHIQVWQKRLYVLRLTEFLSLSKNGLWQTKKQLFHSFCGFITLFLRDEKHTPKSLLNADTHCSR